MTEVKKLKDTIFLPKTAFPMQGNLAKNDPIMIQHWQDNNLYKELRKRSQNKKKFMLHFGPPYANGPIHMGHALTGILKDTINKCYQMMGYDAPLVLGWDCHGLPIEWKIEESYIKSGKKREDVPVVEFMSKCREYAAKWRDTQKEGFKNLGIIFDYDNPYCTMDKSSEATICEEFFKIVKQGYVHRDRKPVMWSVVEKTALAEAELEYHDKTSDTIYVKYPVIKTNIKQLENANAVIWTTTPWTIPASLAIAYNSKFDYVLIEYNNDKLLVANCRLESFIKENNISNYNIIDTFKGDLLGETVCNHPLNNLGFKQEIRLLPADYVTDDAGTGLVHTAPGHGLDDFYLGKKYGLSTETTVNENGTLVDTLPYFIVEHVFKVNPKVIEELKPKFEKINKNKAMKQELLDKLKGKKENENKTEEKEEKKDNIEGDDKKVEEKEGEDKKEENESEEKLKEENDKKENEGDTNQEEPKKEEEKEEIREDNKDDNREEEVKKEETNDESIKNNEDKKEETENENRESEVKEETVDKEQ